MIFTPLNILQSKITVKEFPALAALTLTLSFLSGLSIWVRFFLGLAVGCIWGIAGKSSSEVLSRRDSDADNSQYTPRDGSDYINGENESNRRFTRRRRQNSSSSDSSSDDKSQLLPTSTRSSMSVTQPRSRARTYSSVFTGRLSFGPSNHPSNASTHDDTLSTRVSSGAVKVYLFGIILSSVVSSFLAIFGLFSKGSKVSWFGLFSFATTFFLFRILLVRFLDYKQTKNVDSPSKPPQLLSPLQLPSPPPPRPRAETAEEFFDCLMEEHFQGEDATPNDVDLINSSTVYLENKCVFADDHSKLSAVLPGFYHNVTPEFYSIAGGGMDVGEKMWRETCKWRKEKSIADIHTQPHRHYAAIKTAYPHFIHGFDRKGRPVIYEQPGRMNLKELFGGGCSIEDMVWHYCYNMEFVTEMSRRKTKRGTPELIVVMDVKSISLSKLSGDVLTYLKAASEINSAHYPLSQKKIFVINAPFWFSGAWGGIRNVLPRSARENTSVSSGNFYAELVKDIDPGEIPVEYGGQSQFRLGDSEQEREMKAMVERGISRGLSEALSGSTSTLPQAPSEVVSEDEMAGGSYSFNHVEKKWVLSGDETDDDDDGRGGGGDDNYNSSGHDERGYGDGDSNDGEDLDLESAPLTSGINNGSSNTPGRGRERVFSGDFNDETMTSVLSAAKWNSTLTTVDYLPGSRIPASVHKKVLIIGSVVYLLTCSLQAGLETAVPIYLVGVLSYSPAGVSCVIGGVAFFVLLMSNFLGKRGRKLYELPSRGPLRSLRLGLGVQLFSLLLFKVGNRRFNDLAPVFLYFILIFLCSLTLCSGALARSSSAVLHRLSCESRSSGLFFTRGGATRAVCAMGEIAGAIIFSHFWRGGFIWLGVFVCIGGCLVSLVVTMEIVGVYERKGDKEGGRVGIFGELTDLGIQDLTTLWETGFRPASAASQ